MRLAILLAIVAALWAATLIGDAQSVPVFTQQQADAGRGAYASHCASCHMPDLSGNAEIPPLAGDVFVGAWKNKTTKDLRDYMSAAMPYGGPSLEAETYTVITAYILSTNGATAGDEALTPLTRVPIGDVVPIRVPH